MLVNFCGESGLNLWRGVEKARSEWQRFRLKVRVYPENQWPRLTTNDLEVFPSDGLRRTLPTSCAGADQIDGTLDCAPPQRCRLRRSSTHSRLSARLPRPMARRIRSPNQTERTRSAFAPRVPRLKRCSAGLRPDVQLSTAQHPAAPADFTPRTYALGARVHAKAFRSVFLHRPSRLARLRQSPGCRDDVPAGTRGKANARRKSEDFCGNAVESCRVPVERCGKGSINRLHVALNQKALWPLAIGS